jgi:hypothetical protein
VRRSVRTSPWGQSGGLFERGPRSKFAHEESTRESTVLTHSRRTPQGQTNKLVAFKDAVQLVNILPGRTAGAFRGKCGEFMARLCGGDLTLIPLIRQQNAALSDEARVQESGLKTALSTAFPEFFGRIRMDKATKMFSCTDIVMVVTGCDRTNAPRAIGDAISNYPEFAAAVREVKINGKGQTNRVVGLDYAVELVFLLPGSPKSKARIARYFRLVEAGFWASRSRRLDESEYAAAEHARVDMTDALQERRQRATEHNDVAASVARREHGRREVVCEHGVVDVVTATDAIEVKHVSGWKHAMGQALAYADCTGKRARVHLFGGRLSAAGEETVKRRCVEVTYEDSYK